MVGPQFAMSQRHELIGKVQDDFERQKSDLAKESERNRTGSDRFVGKSDSMEESLKMQTVGLVRLEDFQQKRQALEEEKRRIAARTSALQSASLLVAPEHGS